MKSFSNNDGDNASQFVLSFELLTLLAWLIEHDADKLQKIVDKALTSGLAQKLRRSDPREQTEEITEQARYNIIEFFGLLETVLSTAFHKNTFKCVTEKNLLPALDHIDSTICDRETIRDSLEKTATKLQNHPSDNPEKILFEEILRSWKPGKNQGVH
jgi:hypothetical protein